MSSNELNNLVRAGALKPETGDQKEFDGLLASARARLADAQKATLALESQFDLAYNAAHALSLAAMRWHGYRPDKRYIVFQSLAHTLGVGPEVWRVLDKAHGIRNSVEYEGALDVTSQMVVVEYEGALDVTSQMVVDLLKAAQIVYAAVQELGPIPTKKSGRT